MVSPNISQLLENAKCLTIEERRQFIELLQAQPPAAQPRSAEDRVAKELLRKGLIRKIPQTPTTEDIANFNAWKPVKVEGKPVSETLIDERR